MRTRWFRGLAALCLAAVLLAMGGCGYSLEGTKMPDYLDGARSIAILGFRNQTSEPGLDITLTNQVRDRFLQDGRLRLVDPVEADLILDAVILEYELEPIGFSATDQVRRYRVFVRTHFQLRDTRRGKILINQDLDTDSEYDISTSVAQSTSNQTLTNENAAASFADTLVSLVLEGF